MTDPIVSMPTRSTLNLKHKEQLNFFQRERNSLPDKQKNISTLEEELDKLNEHKDQKTLGLSGYARIKELEDAIKKLKDQVEQIQKNKREYRYLLDAGPIVHEYFDQVKKRTSRTPVDFDRTPVEIDRSSDRNSIEIDRASVEIDRASTKHSDFFGRDSKNRFSAKGFRRADYNERYMSKVDPNYISKETITTDPSYCYRCQQYKDLDRGEAKLVCQKCGSFENETMDSDKPSYSREQSQEISNFAYKRINHFKEILNQSQATENTDIPQDVYDTILIEMQKERRSDLSELDYKMVKKYLKKYKARKYNKFYEHIPHIINRLNGIPPRKFTPIQEEKLLSLFEKIQPAFEKHCPKNRSNFLSYNYIIYKFCELLCYDEFLDNFQLLKSDNKLREQEEVWKKICQEMQFQFIPTL